MAQYVVAIDEDELEELNEIVATIRKEQPLLSVTEQSYVEGVVLGHLRDRMTNAYIGFVRSKTLPELRNLLGTRKDIQNGK